VSGAVTKSIAVACCRVTSH